MLCSTSPRSPQVMPAWMVHKAAGTLMHARIEYEKELAERGEDADGEEADEQDFGEFVEDRFVELYGLKKVATENLRDMLKGLKKASDSHVRLKLFRLLVGIVPNDEEEGNLVSDHAASFYRFALRYLVEVAHLDMCIQCMQTSPSEDVLAVYWCHKRLHLCSSPLTRTHAL